MRLYIGLRHDRARSRDEGADSWMARSHLARATFSTPNWSTSDYETFYHDVPDEPKINKIKANSWFLAAIAYGLCLATWLFFIRKNNVIGIGQTFFLMSSVLAVSTSMFGALLVRWSNISRQYRKFAVEAGRAWHASHVSIANNNIREAERQRRRTTPLAAVETRRPQVTLPTYRNPVVSASKTPKIKAKKIIAKEPEKPEGKGRFDLL